LGRKEEDVITLKEESGGRELQGNWVDVKDVAEPGGFCGQKRLFVLPGDFEKANEKVAGESGGENWRRIMEPPDRRWGWWV
jgi:hypothetical protein